MIIAERKPFAEIKAAVDHYDNILIAGCGTCVAVCLVGGEKEVGLLASQLKLAWGQEGRHPNIGEMTVERQCDREFMRSLQDAVAAYDAVISTACGAGVQFLAALPGMKPVYPALNTTFIGVNEEAGFYTERCRACHQCYLGLTGGICPQTMCPKGLLNGPCGGNVQGMCEVNPERRCAWCEIYERLEGQGRVSEIEAILPLHPYSRCVTPGTVIHPAYKRRYFVHE